MTKSVIQKLSTARLKLTANVPNAFLVSINPHQDLSVSLTFLTALRTSKIFAMNAKITSILTQPRLTVTLTSQTAKPILMKNAQSVSTAGTQLSTV